jgi:transcriptional regulator
MDNRERMHAKRERERTRLRFRALAIMSLREQGWTYERIGRRYGITRQRVFEIVRAQV